MPGCRIHSCRPCSSEKALLDRVELSALLEALDGRDLRSVRLNREHRARLHRDAVDEHGARPAIRCVAPDVRSGRARDSRMKCTSSVRSTAADRSTLRR